MRLVISEDKNVTDAWQNTLDFVNTLSSEDLFKLIMFSVDNEERKKLIERDFDKIIERCSFDYDMYNFFTILALKFTGGVTTRTFVNK